MNYKIFAWVMVISLFLVTGVNAQSEVYCSDNTTLVEFIEWNFTVDGDIYPMSDSEITLCEYGCDNVTRMCSPDPYNRTLFMTIPIILIFMGIAIYLVRK